jgi:uncharacterized protein
MSRVGRIDEKGPLIPIDDAARMRLRDGLDRDGVVAASLFGSQAVGEAGPLSDVHVAVWLDPSLSDSERFRLRLEVIGQAASALRTNEVDLVVLNDAPPVTQASHAADGCPAARSRPRRPCEAGGRAVSDYLDTMPLRERLTRAMRTRIDEGRFGRP